MGLYLRPSFLSIIKPQILTAMKKLTIGIAGSFRYDEPTREAFDTYITKLHNDGYAMEFIVPLREWSHMKLVERLACITNIYRDIDIIPIVSHDQYESMMMPKDTIGKLERILRRAIFDISPRNKFIKIPQTSQNPDNYIQNSIRSRCDYVIFGDGQPTDIHRLDANDIFLDTYRRKCETSKLVYLTKLDMAERVSLEAQVQLQIGAEYITSRRGKALSNDIPEDLVETWAEYIQSPELVDILERSENLYDIFLNENDGNCRSLGLKIFAYAYLYNCNWAVSPTIIGTKDVWVDRFRQFAIIVSALAAAPEEYYTDPIDIFDFRSYDKNMYIFQ